MYFPIIPISRSYTRALDELKSELDRIQRGETPLTPLMQRLQREAIAPFKLPLQPFYDLLSAFSQDVVKTRYQDFGDLIDYCRRSANPVGRIMLHLYGQTDEVSIAQSDGICTALQLINFWQDVAVDWQKGRVYIPQDDLQKFNVSEAQIAEGKADFTFQRLMASQASMARTTISSLNAHKSSILPPPRQTINTSHSARCDAVLIAWAI